MKTKLLSLALLIGFAAPAFAQIDMPESRTYPVAGKHAHPEAMVAIERANETLSETNLSLRAALESMDEPESGR
jgi:hypothetical protein